MLPVTPDLVIVVPVSIEAAMSQLEASGRGFVVCCDTNQRVKGLLTDGDIRRAILDGRGLKDPVEEVMTDSFIFVKEGSSREAILKLLDHRIKFVPVLSQDHTLVGVATKEALSPAEEKQLSYRSKAPVRISFGGVAQIYRIIFMSSVVPC